MDRILVVGADGILGSALLQISAGAGTSRREGTEKHFYRLGDDPNILPSSDVVFLCAATKGFKETEGRHDIFRADVDGNILLVRHFRKAGAFIVFISSDAVEWGGHTAYCRNKLLVEPVVLSYANGAVVRPMKFFAETVGPLANFILDIGLSRKDGIHYWGQR